MKTLIRLFDGKEVSRKDGYKNEANAEHAGLSWKRDCTYHKDVLNRRSFIVIDTEK